MPKISKKILIIEDDKDFLYILQSKFEKEGFSAIAAENGEDGVSMTQKEKPDLIVSDILMPKLDGIEMGKKIREFNKDIYILFLTNISDVDYTDSIKTLGNAESLIKSSLRINDIVEKVQQKLALG